MPELVFRQWTSSRNDTVFKIMVPLDSSFSDFDERMADAIGGLEVATRWSGDDLLRQILSPRLDVISVRAVQDTGPLDSISLAEGKSLIDGAYDMLRYAAATIALPKANVGGPPTAATADVIANARFGQTSVGSYVVNLIVPLRERVDEEASLPRVMPKDREITLHLSKALRAAQDAATNLRRTSSYSDVARSVSDGVSSNLYESIANMFGGSQQTNGLKSASTGPPPLTLLRRL